MDSEAKEFNDRNETIGLSRKEIFFILKNHLNEGANVTYERIELFMSEKLQSPFNLTESLKLSIKTLKFELYKKWQQAKRMEERFLKNNSDYLDVFIPLKVTDEVKSVKKSKAGRPKSEFASSSERTKRRRTEDLRSQVSTEELSYATQMSLRADGRNDAAHVVKNITSGSPSVAKKYRKSADADPEQEKALSADSALSVMIELQLSVGQYRSLRAVSKQNNSKLFPAYNTVLEAKNKYYPPKLAISVTESSAEVELQALLDHMSKRILQTQTEVIKSLDAGDVRHLNLICKWGCDGTSGQSVYKQKFNDDDGTKSDANIFFTSLVPLQLQSVDNAVSTGMVVWQNPRTFSPRFCRPIRIQFVHETTEITTNETEYIQEKVNQLTSFGTELDGKQITISYTLALTMIDGKVCNAVTETTSAQRCYLCNATISHFNNIDELLQMPIKEDFLCFGLSTLHAWIRFFECLLHLAYKLEVKKWRVSSKKDKESVAIRSKKIKEDFKLQLGLIVDQPKPGCGSSNDGNTARRFFEHSSTSASITGIDENLIQRFHVILQAISSGLDVNILSFQEYCRDSARHFVHLYPWCYMQTTLHKILIHGAEVITPSILPIGQMAEDAQESTNKYIKRFREDFSRKFSRTKTMEDVFLRLLVSSDPFITSQRKLPHKKIKELSPETLQLLISPTDKISDNVFTPSSPETSDLESNDDENFDF